MSKPKILYVDDERLNLLLFKANLDDRYTVLTALNGVAAMEMIADHPDIKVVFSDMRMPVMNGIQFLNKARKLLPDVPFFILTGFDITEEISSALEEGLIRKHISKPFHFSHIKTELEVALIA